MKIAEIKNIETKELVEKLEAAVDALNKKKINHNVTPLENPSGPLLFVKFSLTDFGIQTRDVATNSFNL